MCDFINLVLPAEADIDALRLIVETMAGLEENVLVTFARRA